MRIFRISNVLILVLATGLGSALFWTSQKVQNKQDALATLTGHSNHEIETLNVLTVEWDYLNRPQRLEQLAHQYLHVVRPQEDSIVVDASVIMEPVTPAIPLSKPVIIPAMVQPAAPKPAAPTAPVIQQNDSDRFQTLLENLSGGQ